MIGFTARAKTVPCARHATVRTTKSVPVKQALVGVAASVLLAAAPAVAADLALGEDTFSGNCATCHSGGNNILIPDRTLKKAAIEKYLEGGFNVTAIVNQVTNGKGQMPAWSTVLDDDEIQAVAEYVYATASSDSW